MSLVQERELLRGLRRLRSVTPLTVAVDPMIDWLVVRVEDHEGNVGLGEGTLERRNGAVAEIITRNWSSLLGRHPRSELARRAQIPESLEEAAAHSALNQALWDLTARQNRVQLAIMRAGHQARAPRLCANLNRAIGPDRSPAAFAAAARCAKSQGYKIVKIAPFDGVERHPLTDVRTRTLVQEGLRRTAAVIEAADIEVRVDLHRRFELAAAVQVVQELSRLKVGWIEAPVRENAFAEWKAIRARTGVRLAGGGCLTRPRDYAAFLDASGVDVVVPDIKYCGGVDGFREVLEIAGRFGAAVAPHNPSGPIATLATIHAAAGHRLDSLEVPWRDQPNAIDVIEDGKVVLPSGDGLGLWLPTDVERIYPSRRSAPGAPNT